MKGKIKAFNEEKGYGFISSENGEDVFFHISSISGLSTLLEEKNVEFKVLQSEKGLRAEGVALTEDKEVERNPKFVNVLSASIKTSNIKAYELETRYYLYIWGKGVLDESEFSNLLNCRIRGGSYILFEGLKVHTIDNDLVSIDFGELYFDGYPYFGGDSDNLRGTCYMDFCHLYHNLNVLKWIEKPLIEIREMPALKIWTYQEYMEFCDVHNTASIETAYKRLNDVFCNSINTSNKFLKFGHQIIKLSNIKRIDIEDRGVIHINGEGRMKLTDFLALVDSYRIFDQCGIFCSAPDSSGEINIEFSDVYCNQMGGTSVVMANKFTVEELNCKVKELLQYKWIGIPPTVELIIHPVLFIRDYQNVRYELYDYHNPQKTIAAYDMLLK